MEANDNTLAAQPPTTPETSPEGSGLRGEHVDGHKLISGNSGTAHTPEPGTKCDGCGRTVPHPKKPSSPTSKTRAYKVPVDELDAHNEVLDAAAEHIGAKGLPFAQFKTVTAALVALLQDEGAKGLHG